MIYATCPACQHEFSVVPDNIANIDEVNKHYKAVQNAFNEHQYCKRLKPVIL